jgi:uncharacterized protein YidB (DUF937 family)
MGLFEDVKSAVATKDPAKIRAELQELVGDLDLASLKQRFDSSGLGAKVDSWISTGKNLPATADDIKSALGDKLELLAGRLGIGTDEAAESTAEVLPDVVDTLTPEGEVPAATGIAAGSDR